MARFAALLVAVTTSLVVLGAIGAASCGEVLSPRGDDLPNGTSDAGNNFVDGRSPTEPPCATSLCQCTSSSGTNNNAVDLKTNPANCGRCGRVCLSTDCRDGACMGVTAVGQVNVPRGVYASNEFLAYTAFKTGLVMKIPLGVDGRFEGAAPITIATGQDNPLQLIGTPQRVFWTNYSGDSITGASLKMADLTCGASCAVDLTNGPEQSNGELVALAKTGELHWTAYFSSTTTLYHVNIEQKTQLALWTLAQRATGLVNGADKVYVAVAGMGVYVVPAKVACSLANMCPEMVVTYTAADVQPGLADDGEFLIFTRPSTGAIERMNKTTRASVPIALDQIGIRYSPIVDGTDVFWITHNNGVATVLQSFTDRPCDQDPSAKLIGCPRALLRIPTLLAPGFFAVNATTIFVAIQDTESSGRIVFGPR